MVGGSEYNASQPVGSRSMVDGANTPAGAKSQLRQLCRQAITEFGPLCLWWADPDKVSPATIVRALRESGGHAGLRCASRIEEAMRAADGFSVEGSAHPRR